MSQSVAWPTANTRRPRAAGEIPPLLYLSDYATRPDRLYLMASSCDAGRLGFGARHLRIAAVQFARNERILSAKPSASRENAHRTAAPFSADPRRCFRTPAKDLWLIEWIPWSAVFRCPLGGARFHFIIGIVLVGMVGFARDRDDQQFRGHRQLDALSRSYSYVHERRALSVVSAWPLLRRGSRLFIGFMASLMVFLGVGRTSARVWRTPIRGTTVSRPTSSTTPTCSMGRPLISSNTRLSRNVKKSP